MTCGWCGRGMEVDCRDLITVFRTVTAAEYAASRQLSGLAFDVPSRVGGTCIYDMIFTV